MAIGLISQLKANMEIIQFAIGIVIFALIYFYQKRVHDLKVARMGKQIRVEFASPNQNEKKINKKK